MYSHLMSHVSGQQVQVARTSMVLDTVPAMFPGLTRVDDDIIASFSTVPDGWPGGRVGLIRSSDDGASWSEPTWVVEPDGTFDAALSAVSTATTTSGRVLLPYNTVSWPDGGGTDARQIAAHVAISDDAGRTWSAEPASLPAFHGPCVYGKIITTDSGTPGEPRLLWPVWGQEHPDERWRSTVFVSDDDGRSFAKLATVAYDPDARLTGGYAVPAVTGLDKNGNPLQDPGSDPDFRPHASIDGFNETTMIELEDRTLLAVARQQGARGDQNLQFFESRSADGGATWTEPTGIGISGMSPSLHLTDGGVPLLSYRRHAPERGAVAPGVEVRSGDQRGERWSTPTPLVDPHGHQPSAEYQCGYPAFVDVADGDVLAVFYSFRPRHGRYLAANWLSLH